MQRSRLGDHQRHHGVTSFVVSRMFPIFFTNDVALALNAHQNLVFGLLKIPHRDHFAILARRNQSRFVHQIGQVRARKPGSAAGNDAQFHIVAERDLLGMNLEDRFASADIRQIDHHAAVKAAGTQQSGIEHIGTVGRGDENHAFVRFKAIHFDQQLVQRLLAFVVSAAQASAAVASDGVDFIDEDDAGSVLFALLEEVADAAGADADEHLNKVGTGDGEKRDIRFAGDRPRQQSLTSARRANQQNALRNASAELLELLRLTQEFDDLLQFFLGFLNARHVLEGDLLLLRGMQTRPRLAEAQRLVAARLHLTHHEDPERQQQYEGNGVHEQ